ncbi:MAG: hypothetical protein GY754_25950 [bacterium]|nr:hypothetical protein [bacterium]
MIRTIIVAVLLSGGCFFMSNFYFLYPRAGMTYVKKHREMRKSVRHGSGVYYGHYGSGGYRGGK